MPLQFEEGGLGRLIVRELDLGDPDAAPDLAGWRALVERIKAPKPVLEIALVGKYIELPDAYLSSPRRSGTRPGRTASTPRSAGSTPRR